MFNPNFFACLGVFHLALEHVFLAQRHCDCRRRPNSRSSAISSIKSLDGVADSPARGNSRQGCPWRRVARADGDSQVSALGVDLPSGAPFACKHRLKHRNRPPGQQGLRAEANLLGRNLDGNQIARSTEHVLDMRISCFVMVENVRRGNVIAY